MTKSDHIAILQPKQHGNNFITLDQYDLNSVARLLGGWASSAPVNKYLWSNDEQNRVTPYCVVPRLKENIRSAVVSNYYVFRLKNSQQTTLIILTMPRVQFETYQISVRSPRELCWSPIDNYSPWFNTDFCHLISRSSESASTLDLDITPLM